MRLWLHLAASLALFSTALTSSFVVHWAAACAGTSSSTPPRAIQKRADLMCPPSARVRGGAGPCVPLTSLRRESQVASSPSPGLQPFLEHGQAVPTPEGLAVHDEEGRAEDVLFQGLVGHGLGAILDGRLGHAEQQLLGIDAQRFG